MTPTTLLSLVRLADRLDAAGGTLRAPGLPRAALAEARSAGALRHRQGQGWSLTTTGLALVAAAVQARAPRSTFSCADTCAR